jgi:hypothetical protein
MNKVWQDVASEVRDRLGVGPEALCSLLFTAQSAVFGLSLMSPLDEDLDLSEAAAELMLALDELEAAQPELLLETLAIDLGPVPLDDLAGYRSAIDGLLAAARDQIVSVFQYGLDDLTVEQVLALASVVTHVGSAARRVAGRP